MIRNPNVVRETKSFAIYVDDEDARGIATIETDLFFTPTPGTVGEIELISLGGTDIEELVDMRLDFTLRHSIYGSSNYL